MKNLEDLLRQNRDEFDLFEPENDHFKRFQNKNKKRKSISPMRYWWVAAALVPAFVVLTVFMFKQKSIVSNQLQTVSISTISPEYREVEEYFKGTIEKQLTEFNSLQCEIGNSEKQNILNDLNELDRNCTDLQIELSKNKNNERIINAIIINYKTKAEMLQTVISQVKKNC